MDTTTNTDEAATTTHAVLVPGYWLGAWAWDEVAPALDRAGITPHAVTLPGLEAGCPAPAGLTLDDHVAAVVSLVDGLEGDVVLVGHSGGGPVVQGALDRDPGRIRRVVYVDTGPLVPGIALRSVGDGEGGDIPLPSWEELEAQQSSIEGMDEAALARFRELAVDQPGGVARSVATLADERRLGVPTTVICTSLPSPVLQQLIEAGQMPSELDRMTEVTYVDLPTGHWPMFSRPDDLAAELVGAITATS